MKLLVTGTGRTGTVWLTHALRRAGVDARHEEAYSLTRHGAPPWTCEVSWLAAPYTPLINAHVVHLVRHPLACIRSRAAWGTFDKQGGPGIDRRPKGRFAMEKCPAIKAGKTALERAAIHWVEWNKLVREADELVRIEDVDIQYVRRWSEICRGRGDRPRAGTFVLPDRTINSASWRLGMALEWREVEHIPGLIDLARAYGYD